MTSQLRRPPSAVSLSGTGQVSPVSVRGVSRHEEDIMNAYQAEEERISNILSRKLERLRQEKTQLEGVRQAESESEINRLARELSSLRGLQRREADGHDDDDEAGPSSLLLDVDGEVYTNGAPDSRFAPPDVMLEAMRRENESLRMRLLETERDYIRVTRLNESYREELIEYRVRLGIPLDNLIGISTTSNGEPSYRHHTNTTPLLVRGVSSHANVSSPVTSTASATGGNPRFRSSHHMSSTTASAVPIPRPPSVPHHRQTMSTSSTGSSIDTTPLTTSPSSLPASPFPFSPPQPLDPSSYLTQATTPSSASPIAPLPHFTVPAFGLTYPSVPPPSLSSSLGSPVVLYAPRPGSSGLSSPVNEARSRRASFQGAAATTSRRLSIERGGRIAETGSLRSRRGSMATGSHANGDHTLDSISDSGS